MDNKIPEDVITGIGKAFDVDLDVLEGWIYWSDKSQIQRMKMNGQPEPVVSGIGQPYGIAVDVSNHKIYWTDAVSHIIHSANLEKADLLRNGVLERDSRDVTELIFVSESPLGIAVDFANAKLYWTSASGIWRVNLIDKIKIPKIAVDPTVNHCPPISPVFGIALPLDSDGDGLLDKWETTGLDVDSDGNSDLDLHLLGASPFRKDIFVEVDYFENHKPRDEVKSDVETAFAKAPVDSGKGIKLHIDIDELIPGWDPGPNNMPINVVGWSGDDATPFLSDFDQIKLKTYSNTAELGYFGTFDQRKDQNATNIRAAKKLVYHYCLFVHSYTRPGDNKKGSSGLAEIGGNDFLVSLGEGNWALNSAGNHKIGSRKQQSGTFMHEFGHNLGLRHGGNVHEGCKSNYISIMNYAFQTTWIPNPANYRLDYSRETLSVLNESALVEKDGIRDGSDRTFWSPDNGKSLRVGRGDTWLDWNDNGVMDPQSIFDPNTVSVDINNFGKSGCGRVYDQNNNLVPYPTETILTGFNDWANLDYNFRDDPDFQDGIHTDPDIPELDDEFAHFL
ncbi:MAG: hypothetical protein L0287_15395, partial [Anaerolineae bacterium]|nr:hypothetical protein [Anaerolineae bacterium]